jgi:hypothetical protein
MSQSPSASASTHVTTVQLSISMDHADLWEGDGQDERIMVDQILAALVPLGYMRVRIDDVETT